MSRLRPCCKAALGALRLLLQISADNTRPSLSHAVMVMSHRTFEVGLGVGSGHGRNVDARILRDLRRDSDDVESHVCGSAYSCPWTLTRVCSGGRQVQADEEHAAARHEGDKTKSEPQ